ncbi:hypothetical protein, partial [Chryseobacterium sp. SIMBA_038]
MINKVTRYTIVFFLAAILFSCSTTKKAVDIGYLDKKTDSLYTEIQRIGLEATKKNNVPGVAIAVIQN